MAVVISIARGHDASYPFKTIGAAEGPVITGERGAGYYLSAVEKGGEPAGTWVGNGAAELGRAGSGAQWPPAGRVLRSALLQRAAARRSGRTSPPGCRAAGIGLGRRWPDLD